MSDEYVIADIKEEEPDWLQDELDDEEEDVCLPCQG